MQEIAFDATPDFGKPPLLLIHGFLVSRNVWLGNQALSDHFRIIRVDLPGHGRSPAPDVFSGYKPREIAKAIEQLRTSLGISRWHICGQSLGACVALWYAYDYPAQTGAVAFTNANMAIRNEGEYDTDEFSKRAERIRCLDGAGVREERFHPAFATRIPDPLREILAQDADQIPRSVAANYIDWSLTQPLGFRLKSIRSPLMLVNGVRERSFQDLRERFEREVTGAQVVDLDGGHAINIECPTEFNTAVVSFLQRHDGELTAPYDARAGRVP